MRVPTYLQGEAKAFWQRHARRLADQGLLTDADTESFALLAEVWALIRATDPHGDSRQAIKYIALLKQYQALAKQFGLMPKDRKRSNLDTAGQDITDAIQKAIHGA